MRPRFLTSVIGLMAVGALLLAAAPMASAQDPVPMTVNGNGSGGCCNPCAKCKPVCPPCIVYKGCPSPCGVERVVTVCKPCGCTAQVTVMVPPGCEKVRVHRDGDQRIEVGRYGVHLDWRDRGSKLVVRYHS